MINGVANGETIFGGIKVRWGYVREGQPVTRHVHSGGHFTTFFGHVRVWKHRGTAQAVCFDIVEKGGFYVGPGESHEIEWLSGPPAFYTCVGAKDF